MMTFGEFLEAMQTLHGPVRLSQSAVSLIGSPGREDTKRAIERARRLGKSVTPADLTNAISPESQDAANQGVLDLSIAPFSRITGSTLCPLGTRK